MLKEGQMKTEELDRLYASRLESAYMGEHFNCEPKKDEPKRLSLTEERRYKYIKSHPNYTMPEVCRVFHLCQADYIAIKRNIGLKGWPINGCIAQSNFILEEVEVLVLNYIKEHSAVSIKELVERTRLSPAQIEWVMARLEEKGLL